MSWEQELKANRQRLTKRGQEGCTHKSFSRIAKVEEDKKGKGKMK